MWKNIVLTAYTVIIIVLVILFASGRLGWVKPVQQIISDSVAISDLEKAAQLLKPQLFEIGDKKLICTPNITARGKDYTVNYIFYEYIDDKLRAVEYSHGQ